MKKLYKFYWDCGRNGNIEGYFVSTPNQISNAIGKQVYLGEVLGKHSEIYGNLEESDIQMITENQELVKLFEENIGYAGYNPLHYLENEDE